MLTNHINHHHTISLPPALCIQLYTLKQVALSPKRSVILSLYTNPSVAPTTHSKDKALVPFLALPLSVTGTWPHALTEHRDSALCQVHSALRSPDLIPPRDDSPNMGSSTGHVPSLLALDVFLALTNCSHCTQWLFAYFPKEDKINIVFVSLLYFLTLPGGLNTWQTSIDFHQWCILKTPSSLLSQGIDALSTLFCPSLWPGVM